MLAALGRRTFAAPALRPALRSALPAQPAAAIGVGSYVTFTDEAGVEHATVVRRVEAPDAPAAAAADGDAAMPDAADGAAPAAAPTGARCLVSIGFEGALRQVPVAALAPRASSHTIETVAQLRELARRSAEKLDTYYQHMLRAAHEAATMSRLLDELDDDGVVVVADWCAHAHALSHQRDTASRSSHLLG